MAQAVQISDYRRGYRTSLRFPQGLSAQSAISREEIPLLRKHHVDNPTLCPALVDLRSLVHHRGLMPNKKRLLRPARVFDHHGTVLPGPTKDVLLQGLADAGTSFERGELAYLAVTSKVEFPVRDRFAWELHRRLEDRSLLVAREWRRADLAVVREGDAVVVIESTALYAFDVLREPGLHKYRAKVTGDLAKAAALAPHADAYALVLCTHILGEIAPQLKRWVVKYSSGIIGAAKSHGHAGQEAARQALGGELSQLGPSDRREMPSGSVWGLDVVVDAWLVGPISRPQLSRKHSQLSV